MVALANIGDNPHIAHVKAQALTQHATTRTFKHGSVGLGVHQHLVCAFRPTAVACVDQVPIHHHAFSAGKANAQIVVTKNLLDQANRGGFAVGACDCYHWNAAVFIFLEHQVDHGCAHIAPLANRWLQVHSQARCSVQFNNAATLRFK